MWPVACAFQTGASPGGKWDSHRGYLCHAPFRKNPEGEGERGRKWPVYRSDLKRRSVLVSHAELSISDSCPSQEKYCGSRSGETPEWNPV